VALPAGLLAAGMTADTMAAVPATLLEATVQAALGFAEQPMTSAALASTRAVVLARGILYAMTLSKLKILGAVTLASVVGLGGMQAFAYQFGGIGGGKPTAAKPAAGDRQAALASTVEKLQAELDASTRRSAELQKELQDIRAELQALRAGPQEAVAKKDADFGKSQTPANPSAGTGTGLPSNRQAAFGSGRDEPTYQRIGRQHIFMVSPAGDKVSMYNITTEKAKSVRLSGSKEAPLTVVPVFGNGPMALMLKGPKIAEIAVYCFDDGKWYRQELAAPVAGEVSPIVGGSVVVYTVGRSIYAFGLSTKHWSVQEVPEGINPSPVVSLAAVTLEAKGHIYEFRDDTGEWKHTDIRARLKAALDEENEAAKPQP
jgi:hypothetical protein